MNKLKRICKVCVLLLVFTMVSPSVLPMSNVAVAQAATIKLSKKELTLEIGKTKTLKVSGTTKKVIWSTSKKSVATVSKSGKVTAKKAGKATITATIDKKEYTCKVIVKEVEIVNPYITAAPFDAQEFTFAKINYIIPKDWTKNVVAEQGNNIILLMHPTSVDATKGYSNISLTIQEINTVKPKYSEAKEYFAGIITEEFIVSQLAQSGLEVTLSDFKTSDYETPHGTAFKTEYKAAYEGGALTQVLYDLYLDNYFVEITITDIADGTPQLNIIGEYLLNSLQVTK